MLLLVVLDPITSLLLHLLHDVVTFVLKDFILLDLPSRFEVIHVLHAGLPALILYRFHLLQGVLGLFHCGLRPARHAKEEHLFLAHHVYLFACQDALQSLLDE
jgi:hypothetical protein